MKLHFLFSEMNVFLCLSTGIQTMIDYFALNLSKLYRRKRGLWKSCFEFLKFDDALSSPFANRNTQKNLTLSKVVEYNFEGLRLARHVNRMHNPYDQMTYILSGKQLLRALQKSPVTSFRYYQSNVFLSQ